jgi:hypothetical protein
MWKVSRFWAKISTVNDSAEVGEFLFQQMIVGVQLVRLIGMNCILVGRQPNDFLGELRRPGGLDCGLVSQSYLLSSKIRQADKT